MTPEEDAVYQEAIVIANEMKTINNDKADDIIEKIYEDIDMKQYEGLDTNVVVMVAVRKGKDIYSLGYSSEIRFGKGHSGEDVFKFLYHVDSSCRNMLSGIE